MPTAAEIAQVSGNEFASYLLTAVRAEAPIFSSMMALPLMGTSFLTLAITALPTPSGVLDLNQGYVGGKVTMAMGKVEAKRFGILVQAAKSSTDLWNAQNRLASGANIGRDYLSIQAAGALKAELNNIDKLIIGGTDIDAKSFPGLKQICAATTANTLALTDAPEAVSYIKSAINAGGTAASTASSVYAICEGEEEVALRVGGMGGIEGFLNMSQVQEVYLADPDDSTRKQRYYVTDGEGYLGLSVMGSSAATADRKFYQYCARRLFNLTADSGATLTQAKMDTLLESFPSGHTPTRYLMSKRSQRQLRDDMYSTATVFINAGDARNNSFVRRAPLPDNYDGIPIVASEWIGSADAVEVPA